MALKSRVALISTTSLMFNRSVRMLSNFRSLLTLIIHIQSQKIVFKYSLNHDLNTAVNEQLLFSPPKAAR